VIYSAGMHKQFIGVAAVILAVATFGCGSSNNTFTCSYAASIGYCYEWTSPSALNSSQVSQLQQQCTNSGIAGATFSTGSTCPTANRVGTCAVSNPQLSYVNYKFVLYSPAYNAQTGQTFCTASNGTWTAG
jgi:hypothetical protein